MHGVHAGSGDSRGAVQGSVVPSAGEDDVVRPAARLDAEEQIAVVGVQVSVRHVGVQVAIAGGEGRPPYEAVAARYVKAEGAAPGAELVA